MLDNEALPSGVHNRVHPLPDFLCILRSKLDRKLHATLHFLDTVAHIFLAELRCTVQKRHSVKIEQIEDFDCEEGGMSMQSGEPHAALEVTYNMVAGYVLSSICLGDCQF